MPKRKQHKLKKKKSKSKQQTKSKCNVIIPLCITIPLCIPTDCRDRVEIETKGKDEVLFHLKCKHNQSFSTRKASLILSCLDNSRKRWDIISNIASWCNSFDNKCIDDEIFWTQYIQTKSKNNEPIPNNINLMIISKIKDIFNECIGSKWYYSRDNWNESKMLKMADVELELVTVGYFRQNVNNINNYYIPMDIINLFTSFYGHLSEYIYDKNKNILFVSIATDPEQRRKIKSNKNNSPFVCNGQYAIYKKGFELNSINRTEFKFSTKILNSEQQSFGIGVGIYNEEMSNNLINGKWILNKDKYLENINKYNNWHRNKSNKWNINDICTLVVSFDQDFVTEYTANWILSISLYKNNNLLYKRIFLTNDLYFKDNEYKGIKKMCHIIFDNKPLSSTNCSSFNLQLMESIDSSIINAIEWWKDLKIGDRICIYPASSSWGSWRWMSYGGEIKYIDGENNDILTLRQESYRALSHDHEEYYKIKRSNPRIMHHNHSIKKGSLENVFLDKFQFIAI